MFRRRQRRGVSQQYRPIPDLARSGTSTSADAFGLMAMPIRSLRGGQLLTARLNIPGKELCDASASPVGVHANDFTGLETAFLLAFACNDAGDPVTVPKCPGVDVETRNRPISVLSNERDPACLFSFWHCCIIRKNGRPPKPTPEGRYTAISGPRSELSHGSFGMRTCARALLNIVSSHSA